MTKREVVLALLVIALSGALWQAHTQLEGWQAAYEASEANALVLSRQLQDVLQERDACQAEFDHCSTRLHTCLHDYYLCEADKATLEECLDATILHLGALPVSVEVLAYWLAADNLDSYEFQDGVFDCRHFSKELVRRLNTVGIPAFIAVVDYDDGSKESHALVAVPTTQGIVFVEPQNDAIMAWPKWRDNYAAYMIVVSDIPPHLMGADPH